MKGSRPADDLACARARSHGDPRGSPSVRRDGSLGGQRPIRPGFSRGPRVLPGGRHPRRRHRHRPDSGRPGPGRADQAFAWCSRLDLSAAMLEKAALNIAAARLADRIRCQEGDAKSLLERFGDGSFEGVVSNTIVHHIPDPAPVLAEMARLVAPRGTLMVRDLARPDSSDAIVQLAELYAGSESPAARGALRGLARGRPDPRGNSRPSGIDLSRGAQGLDVFVSPLDLRSWRRP